MPETFIRWRLARTAVLMTVSVFFSVAGCGRDAAAPPVRSVPGKTGNASVLGRAILSGKTSPPAPIRISGDPCCVKAIGVEMADDSVIVGPREGLANVFVWVSAGISGAYAAPKTPVVLSQRGCAYHPRVFGLMTGQDLLIRSEDPTLHNVHASAEKNRSFNLAMPGAGTEFRRRFEEPEVMVRIRCDVHGWMHAFAGVVPHPFFAVTGPDGAYSLGGLPAGTYSVSAWHESLGTRTAEVTAGGGASAPVDFTFSEAAR